MKVPYRIETEIEIEIDMDEDLQTGGQQVLQDAARRALEDRLTILDPRGGRGGGYITRLTIKRVEV